MTATSSVFWIFALKYWSVALKFELAVGEQEITKKNKLVNALLIGGLVLISVLGISNLTLTLIELKNLLHGGTISLITIVFMAILVLIMLVSCIFVIDAMRRMGRANI